MLGNLVSLGSSRQVARVTSLHSAAIERYAVAEALVCLLFHSIQEASLSSRFLGETPRSQMIQYILCLGLERRG